MSIPASISIMNSDCSLDTIYNHWNGYPDGLGETLIDYYITEDKVRELIALGNVSYVGRKLKPTTSNHSFYNPEGDVTVALGVTAWQPNKEAIHFDTFEDYCKSNMIQEYNYIFNRSQWYIYTVNTEKKPTSFNDFVLLASLLM